MRIIKPSYEILTPISEGGIKELQTIEAAARTSYRTEGAITEDGESAKRMIKMLLEKGHESPIEFVDIAAKFVVDRGVMAEMTRHRLASYVVESTRFCSYVKDKFGKEITVIKPCFYEEGSPEYMHWMLAMQNAEKEYFALMNSGSTPERARDVLPMSLATTICMKTNIRHWRTIFKLRTASDAHPQIREVMQPLCEELKTKIPLVFDDIVW